MGRGDVPWGTGQPEPLPETLANPALKVLPPLTQAGTSGWEQALPSRLSFHPGGLGQGKGRQAKHGWLLVGSATLVSCCFPIGVRSELPVSGCAVVQRPGGKDHGLCFPLKHIPSPRVTRSLQGRCGGNWGGNSHCQAPGCRCSF